MKFVLMIGVTVAVLQQITGINSVFFYAPMIFEQSGIGKDASFMQAVLVRIVNLLATVVAILLIDKLGRRPLMISGLAKKATSSGTSSPKVASRLSRKRRHGGRSTRPSSIRCSWQIWVSDSSRSEP